MWHNKIRVFSDDTLKAEGFDVENLGLMKLYPYIEEVLDKLGEDGWEVYSAHPMQKDIKGKWFITYHLKKWDMENG